MACPVKILMSTLALKQSQKHCGLERQNPRNTSQQTSTVEWNQKKRCTLTNVAKMMIVKCQPRLDSTPCKSCQLAVIHLDGVFFITWI